MTKTNAINDIARRTLLIETLETRRSDSLDFHDLAVWCIKDALEQAYEAGRRETRAAKRITFEGLELTSASEALQHTNADPHLDTAIMLHGVNYAVARRTAEKLEADGVTFAYLHDHEMPDGTHRIMTVPVNE